MSGLIEHIMRVSDPRDFPAPVPAGRHVANGPINTYAEFITRRDAMQAGWDDDDRRKMRLESREDI
jgi:hypothetical protein